MKILPLMAILALAGCENPQLIGTPLTTPPRTQPPNLYTIMQPLCVLLCSNPVSVVREDIVSASGGNAGSLTTGAKSNTQTTSATGGGITSN